jgi:hypothetical protein
MKLVNNIIREITTEKLLIENYCPNDFGHTDECPEDRKANINDCEKCWNREVTGNNGLTFEKKEELKELIGSVKLSIIDTKEEKYNKTDKPLIEFITCKSGDWKVLKMNFGKDFHSEGHNIPDSTWINLINKLGYEVEVKWISDEDMENSRY